MHLGKDEKRNALSFLPENPLEDIHAIGAKKHLENNVSVALEWQGSSVKGMAARISKVNYPFIWYMGRVTEELVGSVFDHDRGL